MGYLNNNTITVDAILTKKGRELLAKGTGFNITQFAVADDEVDYSLWTTSHPLGTSYYGSIIENMPLTEASSDETQVMRYKLVTLPRGTKQIPVITLGVASISLQASRSGPFLLNPSTTNGLNGPNFGYTAVLSDSTAAVLVGSGISGGNPTATSFLGDNGSTNAVVVVGTTFTLTAKDVPAQVTTTLSIIGNETGAIITIPLTVKPQPTS